MLQARSLGTASTVKRLWDRARLGQDSVASGRADRRASLLRRFSAARRYRYAAPSPAAEKTQPITDQIDESRHRCLELEGGKVLSIEEPPERQPWRAFIVQSCLAGRRADHALSFERRPMPR